MSFRGRGGGFRGANRGNRGGFENRGGFKGGFKKYDDDD